MSTIRTRRRWIRIELGCMALLIGILIFPTSPRRAWHLLMESPVYGKIRAELETATLQRQIDGGVQEAKLKLAGLYASDMGYQRYATGNPEELLLPMAQSGNVDAMLMLAFHLRESDPERASQLLLQAADLGDERAQVFSMRALGLDPKDAESFLMRLYQLQLDRPGWRSSFDRHVQLLQKEAASGNEIAADLLDKLPGSPTTDPS